jgi:peroxiredoxin
VSSAPPASLKESAQLGGLTLRLLSDADHENARRFTSYDDFEDLELHSTILIDTAGRVHWKHTGGDPFMDTAFLLDEIKRLNAAPRTP